MLFHGDLFVYLCYDICFLFLNTSLLCLGFRKSLHFILPAAFNSLGSLSNIIFNKHTQCDKHSEVELINSTQHWTDHGINNVKAGPVAAGRAAGPANHAAIQCKPREVFFSTYW